MMDLSAEELKRYSRQMKLKGFGAEGQTRLKNAHVLVIGAGGSAVSGFGWCRAYHSA